MKKKPLSKKLVFNKTTVTQLNNKDLNQLHGGVIVYTKTCYCTVGDTCYNSRYGVDTCIFTNYGDMQGCPVTMTLCNKLYCP